MNLDFVLHTQMRLVSEANRIVVNQNSKLLMGWKSILRVVVSGFLSFSSKSKSKVSSLFASLNLSYSTWLY